MKKLLKYFKQFVLTSFLGATSFSEHRTAKGGMAASSASMCWSGFLTNRQMSWVSIICRVAGSGFSLGSYLMSMGINVALVKKQNNPNPMPKTAKTKPQTSILSCYCSNLHNVINVNKTEF